ncbi:diadenosine tetraphosphate (Ap4A) hydrolase [Longilinea arvoryzae]|uniref:Diadenosine tetraphosphate (Ap4A) hydrolase n=1 Tax=Longilinea arvoryzae TaxID=360412 RepID=A0A0S7B7Y5_9CHLR|nr:HIT domain-containing protein [Longilinea arvoryzae]GAP13278.1 diadenosine tetraphosphate (Ap4A) hydrolase [Longilinea arvoryzae]
MGQITEPQTCFICRKHNGEIDSPGGAVYEDEWVFAGHAFIPDGKDTAYLGMLLLEPKRHVANWIDLSDAEGEAMGRAAARIARALKKVCRAEHVYTFVLGHSIDHLHMFIIPRYPDTPREFWGLNVDDWPGAPRGGIEEIEDLCEDLRSALE